MKRLWRVLWFRFRATFARRWRGLVVLGLLIGAVGGLGIGAVSGARRTQSAFPAYLRRSSASDLQVTLVARSATSSQPYLPSFTTTLMRMPGVRHVGAIPNLIAVPLNAGTASSFSALTNNGEISPIGSVNDEYFGMDRVAVVRGRLADPARADEFVTTAQAAALLHWHVGQVVPFGMYTVQQSTLPNFATGRVPPAVRATARLVGIVRFASQVVRDEVDTYPTFVLFTPALTNEAVAHAAGIYPTYTVVLTRGSRDVTKVEREVIAQVPKGYVYLFHVTSIVEAQVERATKPESIALGLFGLIAVMAGLAIGAQAVSRQQQSQRADLDVLRALGADPAMTITDALVGVVAAIIVGSLLAVAVAIVLSPLTVIGPVRQLERSPGISFDWSILAAGFAVLVAFLIAFAVVNAVRFAPRHTATRGRRALSPAARLTEAAAGSGMSPAAVTGLRFAVDPGRGETAAPVRSALVGTVLAVAVVAATLTFASGLHTLVSHPRLYGWNWTYAIEEGGSGGKFPAVGQQLLSRDADVQAWSGFNYGDVQIDGQTVPALLVDPDAPLGPSMLSGHPIRANNQVVLGAATLAQLHKHIGATVLVSYGSISGGAGSYVPPAPLQVVGTATLPAIGNSGTLHTSMGIGAIMSNDVAPAAFRKAALSPDPLQNGVDIAVVQLRATAPPAAGLASLQQIARTVTKRIDADPNLGGTFDVVPVQQPAEIVSYQHAGNTPATLAVGLATSALIALAIALTASVRRRRRDLALLKTIGFTKRQLLATVAWQASVAALIGLAIGAPIGIAVGRWLWVHFAHNIYAVPHPTVPWPQIALVALGAIALANAAALLPGRTAANTPTALLLKTE